jgi:hypothetical protein
MKKIMLGIAIQFVGLFCFAGADLPKKNINTDAYPLQRAQKALTDVIVHDIFSPPVASRIYAYANIAAYECLVQFSDKYRSLNGQLTGFPKLSEADKNIIPALASVHAFFQTARQLVFSEQQLQDSADLILKWFKGQKISAGTYAASLKYGQLVADSILKWVSGDQYKETRRLRRYSLKKEPGAWLPTPPAFMAAIEPHWNKIRPLVMDSVAQFKPATPTVFSTDSGSLFYQEAREVWETGNKLTPEQTAIANFWDCNPFFLNTQGHLNFASKKISPGGHWMLITTQACQQKGADIFTSAAAYTLTSIALFDGFISCWDEKYRSQLIRPETYINSHIEEGWRPLLQTPPFPEYPSGHSVVSTAAAVVLTQLFGEGFAFTDYSELEYGLPSRHFNSFLDASREAAISRLYGGIHYRPAIVNGQEEGEKIGRQVAVRLRLIK